VVVVGGASWVAVIVVIGFGSGLKVDEAGACPEVVTACLAFQGKDLGRMKAFPWEASTFRSFRAYRASVAFLAFRACLGAGRLVVCCSVVAVACLEEWCFSFVVG
jgi:hypothetical protein